MRMKFTTPQIPQQRSTPVEAPSAAPGGPWPARLERRKPGNRHKTRLMDWLLTRRQR